MPDLYNFEFPAIYLDWLSKFRLFAFDFPSYVSIGCLIRTSYHSKMYGVASSAACLIATVAINLLWEEVRNIGSWLRLRFVGKRGSGADWRISTQAPKDVSTYFEYCLVVSYLIYPSFTAGNGANFRVASVSARSHLFSVCLRSLVHDLQLPGDRRSFVSHERPWHPL